MTTFSKTFVAEKVVDQFRTYFKLFILVADVQYVTAYTSGREDTPYDRVWVTAPSKMFQFRVRSSQNAYIMLAIEPYKVRKVRIYHRRTVFSKENVDIFVFHFIFLRGHVASFRILAPKKISISTVHAVDIITAYDLATQGAGALVAMILAYRDQGTVWI